MFLWPFSAWYIFSTSSNFKCTHEHHTGPVQGTHGKIRTCKWSYAHVLTCASVARARTCPTRASFCTVICTQDFDTAKMVKSCWCVGCGHTGPLWPICGLRTGCLWATYDLLTSWAYSAHIKSLWALYGDKKNRTDTCSKQPDNSPFGACEVTGA